MLQKLFNKKGFTLIELIVVMSVIGILVLLAMPKFMGYTEKARLTEIKNNIKQLENASERYYIKEQSWPRASDTHYTAEELENFANEIKNRTGAVITLDENGKYYPISYDKLQKYVQEPKDGVHYILQNPVGEVFYLDGLTDQGKKELSKETPEQIPEVKFEGLVNQWSLNSKTGLKDSVGKIELIKKGTGEYRLTEDGVYLDGNVQLQTPNIYTFNNTYTIVAYVKKLEINGELDGVIGTGTAAANIGNNYSGFILSTVNIHALNGKGDGNNRITTLIANQNDNNWHTLVYTYDGTSSKSYFDGELKSTAPGNHMKATPLFIGGMSNTPINTASVYFKSPKGYYKNIQIYDRALTDDEIATFK